MASSEHELVRVGPHEVAVSNPRKVLFPDAGITSSTSCATTSPSPTARCAAPAAGRTCSSAIRTASAASSSTRSARPQSRPDVDRGRRAAVSVRPDGGRSRAARRRRARLDGEPRLPRAASASGARRAISIIPTSCASISIPVPGVEWAQVREVAPRRARDARRPRADRLAEDVRVARHPRQRAHRRRAGRSPRCAAPRWRWRARSSAARRRSPPASGGRRNATACSSTTTRTRRTARSPRAYSVRPTAGRARVGAARRGTRSPTCDPARLHARDDAGAVRGGRRPPRRHRRSRRARSRRCSSSRRGTSARGSAMRRGRRTTGSRPASRRACSRRRRRVAEAPAASRSARARKKEDALAGLERWKARHPEAAAHLEAADVLVDAMRGRFQTWTRIRVNLQHVPERPAAGAGAARSRTTMPNGTEARAPQALIALPTSAAPKTFASS